MSGTSTMRWASAVSDRVETRAAVREAVAALEPSADSVPDLVIAFVSPHHAAAYESLAGWVREELGETTFIGVAATGVVGAGRELEGREGLSLTAAWLPNTRVRALHLSEPPANPAAFVERLRLPLSAAPHCLVFADPTSCDSETLLRVLDAAFPKSVKIGGMVVGAGKQPSALFVGDQVHRGGALVCAIDGDCELTTVVAQACRPIGEPYIVTRSRANVIQELNAGKPTEVLRKVYEGLDARDHSLFNTSLFIGIELGSKQGSFAHGDFLIRNVLGIDPEGGAMATDARLSEYQVVQFHLRDRESAAQELSKHLRALAATDIVPRIRGTLMFSNVGRGERLFGTPNHDSDAFLRRIGPVSISGMFCNGEIGPVGGKTFVHGYTSVFGVFSEPVK